MENRQGVIEGSGLKAERLLKVDVKMFRPQENKKNEYPFLAHLRGRGSSIGSEFAWHASGPEFHPHVRHILSWRLGHENISTAILLLPLIQEVQLSVTGERMCTKNW